MKTYLISQGQIKQYVLALIVVILTVFILGYFLGVQQSTSVIESNQTATLKGIDKALIGNKPEISAGLVTDAKQVKKNQNTKAEKNKSDNIKSSKNKVEKRKPKEKKAEKKKAKEKRKIVEKKIQKTEKSVKKESVKNNQPVVVGKTEAETTEKNRISVRNSLLKKPQQLRVQEQVKPSEKKINDPTEQKSALQLLNNEMLLQELEKNKTSDATTDQTSDRRYYSVQAGMFASKMNAGSFIEKLEEKNFDAYMSDFISTSGAIKYNVRVGRFEQRDQARALLREFQKSFSSPAYVVITN